ncbi:CcdC family protein [Ornithinibacillus bavariensis]|uniref:Membrane protein n=1 Tax=Ornithinibacillus bavariensis TaxID=545502 RepID=A0A919X653_9BACI|nr:cytochrome c biogenesis protein CcdC [Ornithinibacillus bavariensis]GIO26251.1 membrane protein [Ornithinibacillus bavariensis]
MFWIIATTVLAFFMATFMIFMRLKASRRPASVKSIILPPLFMSTGAAMFLFPQFQLEWPQVVESIVVGVVFSIFLIRYSKFEIRENNIYLIPSKAFIFILFGLLFVRIILKLIIGSAVSLGETSGMFFLLAFGMIVSWRLAMLYKYKQLEKKLKVSST